MRARWALKRYRALFLIRCDAVVVGHSQTFNLHVRSQVCDMLVDEVVKRRQVAEEGHNDLDLDTPEFAHVLQFDYFEHIVKSQKDARKKRD